MGSSAKLAFMKMQLDKACLLFVQKWGKGWLCYREYRERWEDFILARSFFTVIQPKNRTRQILAHSQAAYKK